MVKDRFDFDANTIEDARLYMLSRAKQLLRFHYKLVNIVEEQWGISAYFDKSGILYQSLYILKDFRGKGIYPSKVTNTIITTKECNISAYLDKKNIKYVELNISFPEYTLMGNIYGSEKSKRSGVYLMNHIDEGLYILEKLKASKIAKAAYVIHPLLQSDESLVDNFYLLEKINPLVILLATEYRSVANEYLSNREISTVEDIRLSPLKEVNQMLIADKIQNNKDFELYHKDIHPRSNELSKYFRNWLNRLEVSDDFYKECVEYCTDYN